MNGIKLPVTGGCLCGNLRFEVSAQPMLTMACHCRDCQRMTGGPYSLSVMVPAQAFSVTLGDPIRGGLREGKRHHMHCRDCLGWVFTGIGRPAERINLRATMLDDLSWFETFIEVWTDEKLPSASVTARHSFPNFPSAEDYPALLEAFGQSIQEETSHG